VFVALGIQHAIRVRRITLPSLACPAVQYFSTLSHERHDFRKKVIEHKVCDLSFSTSSSETFLILRRGEREIIKIE